MWGGTPCHNWGSPAAPFRPLARAFDNARTRTEPFSPSQNLFPLRADRERTARRESRWSANVSLAFANWRRLQRQPRLVVAREQAGLCACASAVTAQSQAAIRRRASVMTLPG